MGLFRTLTGRKDKGNSGSNEESEKIKSQQTVLYKTASGSGSRELEGPFASDDLRDKVLVLCQLAGYTDARTRQIYQEIVDKTLVLTGVPPLTNPKENVYHAYQRAQARRATAYRDIVRTVDPVEHRLQTDNHNKHLLRGEFSGGYPGLAEEIENWRYRWQDVANVLLSDSEAERSNGDDERAAASAQQAVHIKHVLDTITNEKISTDVQEGLARHARHEQRVKQFYEEAAERRGDIAENKGATGEAGYKNPKLVIANAERARSLKGSSSNASFKNSEDTSVKDFAPEP